jgi:hypothetical protein
MLYIHMLYCLLTHVVDPSIIQENLVKKILISCLLLISTIAHSAPTTKIAEIKTWVDTHNKEYTCADEYLKYRYDLGIKMGLSPFIIVGATAVGIFGGVFLGTGIAVIGGGTGLAGAGAVLSGGALGGLTGFGYSGIESTSFFIDFFRVQNLLRLVYDSHQYGGEAVDGYFESYSENYEQYPMTKSEFMSAIVELDTSGALCNGDLVSKKRRKNGKKLSQRLANTQEIFDFLVAR